MAGPQQRFKQQQFLAQQALEQAYLQLARQKQSQQMQVMSGQQAFQQQRAAALQAQMQSADRLGNQVWKQNMPQVSDDINQPIPDQDPGMARVLGETARMMALRGKTVPLHNVPMENMAVNPYGQTVAQAPMLSPYHQGQLRIGEERAGEYGRHNLATEGQGQQRIDKLMDPRTKAIIQLLIARGRGEMGKKDTADDAAFSQGMGTFNEALGQVGYTNQPSASPRPMTAINPQTKQRIQSLDGGKTWQPAQ